MQLHHHAHPGIHVGNLPETREPSEFLLGNISFGAEAPVPPGYPGLPGITWDYLGLLAPLVDQRFFAMVFDIVF